MDGGKNRHAWRAIAIAAALAMPAAVWANDDAEFKFREMSAQISGPGIAVNVKPRHLGGFTRLQAG